jgi:ABC-2 type transport system ATP-binding protein
MRAHDVAADQLAVEATGLEKSYGPVRVLDGVDLKAERGSVFALLGPNGAGKTTAMRIVLGVLEADAGQVCWRGSPIDERTRRRTGYMPEEHGQTFSTQFARARSEPPESVS